MTAEEATAIDVRPDEHVYEFNCSIRVVRINSEGSIVTAQWRWQGSPAKVGIRPTIDGRLGGVRESLEEQTMALAERVAELVSANLRYVNGDPVQCVRGRHHHWASSRSGSCRSQVCCEQRRTHDHRHAGLVLWLRDHGHPSHATQGCLGFQRYRATGCCLPRRSPCGPHSEGSPGCRHLWTRRPRRRRRNHPRRRFLEDSAVRQGGTRSGDDAWQLVPFDRRHLDGNRRKHRGSRLL